MSIRNMDVVIVRPRRFLWLYDKLVLTDVWLVRPVEWFLLILIPQSPLNAIRSFLNNLLNSIWIICWCNLHACYMQTKPILFSLNEDQLFLCRMICQQFLKVAWDFPKAPNSYHHRHLFRLKNLIEFRRRRKNLKVIEPCLNSLSNFLSFRLSHYFYDGALVAENVAFLWCQLSLNDI